MVRQREGAPGDLEWLKYIGGTPSAQVAGRDAVVPLDSSGDDHVANGRDGE